MSIGEIKKQTSTQIEDSSLIEDKACSY